MQVFVYFYTKYTIFSHRNLEIRKKSFIFALAFRLAVYPSLFDTIYS